MMMDAGAQTPFSEAETFFRANGLTDLAQMLPMFKPDRFIRMASGLPRVERFVADSEVRTSSGQWTAMETNGHAEGHLCLSNAAARTLISGDQVLPDDLLEHQLHVSQQRRRIRSAHICRRSNVCERCRPTRSSCLLTARRFTVSSSGSTI